MSDQRKDYYREHRQKNRERLREYFAEVREECKALGLCQRCRKQDARPGRLTCSDCAEKMKKTNAGQYARAKSEGVCLACRKAKPVRGIKYCHKCREAKTKYSRQYRRDIRLLGKITSIDGENV